MPVFRVLEEGGALLTANRRLARQLKASFAGYKRGAGFEVWPTPAIMPWNAWLARPAVDAVVLSARQEQLVWESIIRESDPDSMLLDVPATAQAVAEAWRLVQEWKVPLEDPAWEEQQDPRVFQGWAARFVEITGSRGWIDPASADRRIDFAHLDAPRQILLAGFDELTPRQQEILARLRDFGCGVTPIETARPQPAEAFRLACRTAEDEAWAAAAWARDLIERDPAAHIGVVAWDLAGLRGTLERIFLDTLNPARTSARAFSISMGVALADYPLVDTALVALGLEEAHWEVDVVGRLLRSPFLAGAEVERTARAALDARLRRFGLLELPPETVLREARERCPAFAAALGLERAQGRLTPSQWVRAFVEEFKKLGWPGERPLDSAEYQTLEKWRDLLSDYAALDTVCGPVSRSRALSLLRQSAAETDFQPESDPAPIEIVGALEAAGAEFDHLWVMGLHDQVWPAPARPHPFLPLRLQRVLSLPHSSPSRELEYAGRTFRRLIESAPRVVLSYPEREEDRELRPSPLLKPFPRLPEAPARRQTRGEAMRGAAQLEEVDDSTARPLPPPCEHRGGSGVFRLQAECPFRAFAELRLGAKEMESPGPGLDPRSRGTILHDALRAYWAGTGSHARLLDSGPAEVEAAVTEALERFCRKMPLAPRFRALEQARLEVLLAGWLEVEKLREPFTVEEKEQERRVEFGGVRTVVRTDRVDRLQDGGLVLIDYKTNAPSPSAWESERPQEPQLPLYACTLEGRLAAVAFAQVRPGDLRFNGLAEREGVLPQVKEADVDLEQHKQQWRLALDALGEAFRAGQAQVDPRDPGTTCSRCPLPSLCRINEVEGASGF